MPYAIEQKIVGLGKESSRGVAVDPTRFIAVAPDTEFEYKLNLLEDELVRGIFEKFPPSPGTKEGSGRLAGIEVTSENCGELFLSLLGKVVTDQPDDVNAPNVYRHIFTRSPLDIRMPSYTFHIYRGLGAKRYPLSVVKSITLNGAVDGKLTLEAEVLFKTEEASDFDFSTVSWEDPKPFMFYHTKVYFDDVLDENVKDWSITIDNGSVVQRALIGSQDIKDIVTFAKLLVNGTMNIYFESEAQRNKFLSNSAVSLKIELIGSELEGGINRKLVITLPEIHYTAFPFGDLDGLLGASVSFNAYYKLTAGKTIEIELVNMVSSY